MRTLDLKPVMTALRDRPGDFDMDGSWLRHRPSRHAFLMLHGRLERIEAVCSCAQLRAEPSQTSEFSQVFALWNETYWRRLQAERAAELRAAMINRQFAAHFRRPSRLARLRLRVTDACTAAWAALTRPEPEPLTLEDLPAAPGASRTFAPPARTHERIDA
jgi:hypothetical protein